MDYSLWQHQKAYRLSWVEKGGMGLSLTAYPYAYRHWQIAREQAHGVAHGFMALVLALPVVGLLAAAMERLFYLPDPVLYRMWINSRKALKEHRKKSSSRVYMPLRYALPSLSWLCLAGKPRKALHFSWACAVEQGLRPQMEDAHFVLSLPHAYMVGVLDGHGGSHVSGYAAKRLQELLSEYLSTQSSSRAIYGYFVRAMDKVHKEIVSHPSWDYEGTTVVLCFVDVVWHRIYTATLGDSEATLYRQSKKGRLLAIPLSCVRDWSSRADAKRAALALGNPRIAMEWPKALCPKLLRVPGPYHSLNVSRALGDKTLCGTKEKPLVIQRPKITVNRLQAGDRLILACDGLKDYVEEKEILKRLSQPFPLSILAQDLVSYAIEKKASQDNVTVILASVQ